MTILVEKLIRKAISLNGNQFKLLVCCCEYGLSNPAHGLFYNDAIFKDHIRLLGFRLSDGAINVYISNLATMGFLTREGKGVYSIDKELFI